MLVGESFAGVLVRDGWSIYPQFDQALHQTCLAHPLRRCRETIQMATPAAAGRAEQALRPAVVTRKVWGGNRTVRGAHTQEILASVLQTCGQQNLYSQALLIQLLCFTEPKRLDLMASDLPPPQSSS